jgi:thermopsin
VNGVRSSTPRAAASVLVVAALLASGFGIGAWFTNPAGPTLRPLVPATPGGAAASFGPPTSGLQRAYAIERSIAAAGIPASRAHLPDLPAADPGRRGPVTPTYTVAPAPMGVADLGLRSVGATTEGYVLDAPNVSGTANLTSAEAIYLDGDGPDDFGLQFSAVLSNVTLDGVNGYTFWTQEFAAYSPGDGVLTFGDNVWNFSNPALTLSPNALFSHSANGSLDAPIFYSAVGASYVIAYPFQVSFYLNSTLVGGRPAAYFNYTVSNGSGTVAAGSVDEVVFDSGSAPAPAPFFEVNGTGVNAAGLPSDVELVAVGDGGMDTTSFVEINATFSIDYWNTSRGALVPFPSADNAGSDTGETSDGVDVTTNLSAAGPVARLGSGPSFVGGLWNVSSEVGRRTVTLTLSPVNAFVFLNPGTAYDPATAQWAPTFSAGAGNPVTFYIPNDGSLFVEFLLADYRNVGVSVNPLPNTTLPLPAETLARSLNFGVYTPIFAWGNAELAAVAPVTGSGTSAAPYVLYNNQIAPLPAVFTATNDFLFPVFPGILLIGTNASVVVRPAPFDVRYPSGMAPALAAEGLPLTNDLQLEFWNVSNVTVAEGPAISGWLAAPLAGETAGEVSFWNSSGNLIAANNFDVQGTGLVLVGGSGNTVWGNTFLPAPVPGTNASALAVAPGGEVGIVEAESGDVLYNNYLATPVPAVTAPDDPESCLTVCAAGTFNDHWNITPEPASANRTLLGVNLTGSIIGTPDQGGNYWSNYGAASDPYGVLPYDDGGRIAPGGDLDPLVPFALYSAEFQANGLPSALTWGVVVDNVTYRTNTTNLTVVLPNGSYPVTVISPTGYTVLGVAPLNVSGANQTVGLDFVPTVLVAFAETGLLPGSGWNVTVTGPAPSQGTVRSGAFNESVLGFNLTPGAYNYSISAYGYAATPDEGTFTVTSRPVIVPVAFSIAAIATFNETGLPSGTPWSITVTEGIHSARFTTEATTLGLSVFDLPPGNYTWIATAGDYAAAPRVGEATSPTPSYVDLAFSVVNGTLEGTVAPSNGNLTIDGSVVPLSAGVFILSASPGIYAIEVTASGYAPYYNNVTVTSNSTTLVTISLTALPAPSSGPLGISLAGWGLISGLALLAAVALLLLLRVRRRGRNPPPPLAPPAAVVAPPPSGSPPSPPSAPWEEGPEDRSDAAPGPGGR